MWATVSYNWEMGSEMASLQLKVETERVLSPCYMHYTLFQWEYLHSLIVATVCFDTKKALLSYESHTTGRHRKKNRRDGHNSLQGRRCYILSYISVTGQPNLSRAFLYK